MCRRIAMLEEMGPALIVLLGPEGCGKSHLLWAIAKQVRAGTLPAGLALITPDDIPEKVRGLVEDNRPLQGRRALLLVDGLERFDTEVRRLQAVVDTFLACQHPVIIATSVHPNRLERLTVPLVNRLSAAQTIIIEARGPGGEGDIPDRIHALESLTQDLQRQRDELQEQVDASTAAVESAHLATVEAEARTTALQRMADEARTALGAMQASLDMTRADHTAIEAHVTNLHAEVESARAQHKSAAETLQVALAEKAAAEAQITLFREEAEYAMAQQSRLQGQLSASRMALEESEPLRDTLAATRDRLKGVEFEWAKTRKVLAIQTAEMDALRYETASQVAQASIQAGELEHRIGLLETALESLRTNRPAEGGANGAALKTWSIALESMQAQIAALRETRANAVPELKADDQVLFETDFFEALPNDFEANGNDGEDGRSIPGMNGALKEAVRDAMGGPASVKETSSIDNEI